MFYWIPQYVLKRMDVWGGGQPCLPHGTTPPCELPHDPLAPNRHEWHGSPGAESHSARSPQGALVGETDTEIGHLTQHGQGTSGGTKPEAPTAI